MNGIFDQAGTNIGIVMIEYTNSNVQLESSNTGAETSLDTTNTIELENGSPTAIESSSPSLTLREKSTQDSTLLKREESTQPETDENTLNKDTAELENGSPDTSEISSPSLIIREKSTQDSTILKREESTQPESGENNLNKSKTNLKTNTAVQSKPLDKKELQAATDPMKNMEEQVFISATQRKEIKALLTVSHYFAPLTTEDLNQAFRGTTSQLEKKITWKELSLYAETTFSNMDIIINDTNAGLRSLEEELIAQQNTKNPKEIQLHFGAFTKCDKFEAAMSAENLAKRAQEAESNPTEFEEFSTKFNSRRAELKKDFNKIENRFKTIKDVLSQSENSADLKSMLIRLTETTDFEEEDEFEITPNLEPNGKNYNEDRKKLLLTELANLSDEMIGMVITIDMHTIDLEKLLRKHQKLRTPSTTFYDFEEKTDETSQETRKTTLIQSDPVLKIKKVDKALEKNYKRRFVLPNPMLGIEKPSKEMLKTLWIQLVVSPLLSMIRKAWYTIVQYL
nr:hypothetical protein [Cryptomonas paramecium]